MALLASITPIQTTLQYFIKSKRKKKITGKLRRTSSMAEDWIRSKLALAPLLNFQSVPTISNEPLLYLVPSLSQLLIFMKNGEQSTLYMVLRANWILIADCTSLPQTLRDNKRMVA